MKLTLRLISSAYFSDQALHRKFLVRKFPKSRWNTRLFGCNWDARE